MSGIILFSDTIRALLQKIGLFGKLTVRIFKVLLSPNWKLSRKELNFSTRYNFENGLLIIRYDYENAIWYRFKKIRFTIYPGLLALNISNLHDKQIVLIVQGLFQRKKIIIPVTTALSLHGDSWSVSVTGIRNRYVEVPYHGVLLPVPYLQIPNVQINHPAPAVTIPDIRIIPTTFQQTDYI